MSSHLDIDRIRCDGRGMCAELLPEMIELDDWGYPIIGAGEVPDPMLSLARAAVASCPVMALSLSQRQGPLARQPQLTAVSQPRHNQLSAPRTKLRK